MATDLDQERDYSPEALREKEKQRRLDDEGAAPMSQDEQDALNQIEAGYGQTAPDADYSGSKNSPESQNDQSDGGGLYKPSSKGKASSWRSRIMTRKNATGAGALGLGIGGMIWIASIASGPAQIIQMAQLLNRVHFGNDQTATESRIGRMFEFFRTGNDPSKRNVGYMMEQVTGRYIDKLKSEGITLSFEEPNGRLSRRLQGLTLDLETDVGKKAASQMRAEGFNIGEDGFVNLRRDGENKIIETRQRKKALYASVDLRDKGVVASAIQKRLLALRAGVNFHPYTNAKRTAIENLSDWRDSRRAERSEEMKEGVDTTDGRRLEGQDDVDDDGNATENPGNNETANAGNEAIDDAVDIDTRKSRLQFAGKLAGSAAAVVSAMCVARDVGNDIPKYQHENIVLPSIRMAMLPITAGSQIMTGQDINLDEVGVLADDFYDDAAGTSVWGAAAMQATKGEEVTGPDAKAKPSDVGDKPLLFDILDNIPGLSQTCGVSNAIGNIPIIKQVTGVIDDLTGYGIDAALGLAGWSMDELMNSLVAFLSGDVVDTLAQGSDLGNIIAIGARLAGNESCIAKGCTALSPAESGALREYQQEMHTIEQRQKPMLARIFDPYDADSLFGSLVVQNQNLASFNSSIVSFASLPSKLPSLFGNSLSALNPRASAATTPGYDFGVDSYGFDVGELESEDYEDPYKNAEFVEGRLDDLNNKYGDCFVTTVNPDTFALQNGESVNYLTDEYREKCSEPSDPAEREEFNRYRFYLLDTITAKSAACYEGLDETSCAELGFGTSNEINATPGASGVVNPEGYSFPLAPQNKSVGGINSGHHDGTPAFDLFSTDSAAVYAIYGGTPTRINTRFSGVEGCSRVQFRADDGFYYWYGHLKNVVVREDQHIEAGTQIAQIADKSLGSKCYGGAPHLHIDRGCTKNGVPQPGGADACRDPDFIPFLRALWDTLPNAS